MKTTMSTESQATTERSDGQECVTPVVNIFETREGYALEAEMPGVSKDGLEITLAGNEITIRGRRAAVTVPGEPLFRERSTLDFRRVFELDPAIDTDRISAKMDQGVLTLSLPKSERVQPRRIAVSE
jgi:HSP20 family protein